MASCDSPHRFHSSCFFLFSCLYFYLGLSHFSNVTLSRYHTNSEHLSYSVSNAIEKVKFLKRGKEEYLA